jgi:hypothetical protein
MLDGGHCTPLHITPPGRHTPSTQTCPAWHITPTHEGSVQRSEKQTWVALQSATLQSRSRHMPFAQAWVALQLTPQAPQLVESVCRLTQVFAHTDRPAPHISEGPASGSDAPGTFTRGSRQPTAKPTASPTSNGRNGNDGLDMTWGLTGTG